MEESLKLNMQMYDPVSYMKTEERDRLIREEGELIGYQRGVEAGRLEGKASGKVSLISIIRRKAARGLDAAAIAELLENGQEEIEEILALHEAHPEWTDFQIAEALVRKE